MIKITKILNSGGSCPFQIDALTDDNRMIYGRYRFSHLTVRIGKHHDLSDYAAVDGDLVFQKHIGGQFDGYLSLEEFIEHTKEVLDFSDAKDMLEPC